MTPISGDPGFWTLATSPTGAVWTGAHTPFDGGGAGTIASVCRMSLMPMRTYRADGVLGLRAHRAHTTDVLLKLNGRNHYDTDASLSAPVPLSRASSYSIDANVGAIRQTSGVFTVITDGAVIGQFITIYNATTGWSAWTKA